MSMRCFAIAAVVAACMLACATANLSPGKCLNNIPLQTPFDVSKYASNYTWYEWARFGISFENDLSCVHATYYPDPSDKSHVVVYNTGIRNGQQESIQGYATIHDAEHPAWLEVKFPGQPVTAPYKVVWVNINPTTGEYDQAIVYSCVEIAFEKAEFSWVLSKAGRVVEPEIWDKIVSVAQSLGINTKEYTYTLQKGCTN
eukprot:ANDGO_07476.mRNA.1 Outer membrane lipoprotein Blc